MLIATVMSIIYSLLCMEALTCMQNKGNTCFVQIYFYSEPPIYKLSLFHIIKLNKRITLKQYDFSVNGFLRRLKTNVEHVENQSSCKIYFHRCPDDLDYSGYFLN